MNAKEFIHYFKGGIELGQLTELNEKIFNMVAVQLNNIESEVSAKNNFCIWLKGVFDVSESNQISTKQLKIIVEKLNELNINNGDYGNLSHLTRPFSDSAENMPRC